MYPARFMPLYELKKLYNSQGRRDEALTLAKTIYDKEVKVPSNMINTIKDEMRLFIEKIEMIETTDEPKCIDLILKPIENEGTSEGTTPKPQPNGAALPP